MNQSTKDIAEELLRVSTGEELLSEALSIHIATKKVIDELNIALGRDENLETDSATISETTYKLSGYKSTSSPQKV